MFPLTPPFFPVLSLIQWPLDECYRVLTTLVRYRLPPGLLDKRGWARVTLYHATGWYFFGLPASGLLFLLLRLADLVALLPLARDPENEHARGRPFWVWRTLHPMLAWWLETLLLGGLLWYASSPAGQPAYRALFGQSNFMLGVFATGFVWRCLTERFGTDAGVSNSPAITHGSARLAREKDVRAAGLRRETGLFLGNFGNRPLFTTGEGNLLSVAPSGTGKGTSIMIPNLLLVDSSIVALDVKGENFTKTHRRRRAMHQKVVRLDPWALCGAGSDSYNPLDRISADDPHVNDHAIEIADMLMVPDAHDAQPYWNGKAGDFLRIFVLYVLTEVSLPHRHLGHLRWIVTQPAPIFNAFLHGMTKSKAAGGLVARGAATILAMPERERASVMGFVHRHTAFLDSPAVQASLKTTTFDPQLLVTGKLTVYLVIGQNRLTAYNRLVRLWIGSLLEVVTARGLVPPGHPRVCFLLDEVGQLARLEQLVRATTLLRGYGCTVWSIVQDINQLKKAYPDDEWRTIMANSRYRTFSNVADIDTAEYVSASVGDTTVVYITRTDTSGSSDGDTINNPGIFRWWGSGLNRTRQHNASTAETEQHVGRRLLTPDEIMRLPTDQQILLLPTCPPVLARKVEYFRDRKLKPLAD